MPDVGTDTEFERVDELARDVELSAGSAGHDVVSELRTSERAGPSSIGFERERIGGPCGISFEP
jgi:hypothetical protein